MRIYKSITVQSARKAIHHRIWHYIFRDKFKKLGKGSFIWSALKLEGRSNIEIDKDVYIGYKAWLAAKPLANEKDCLLKFGEGCVIGNFNHIYATKGIVFGRKVLTADKVYISDNLHNYSDISTSIMDQPIRQLKVVSIGEGTWIGENVCIMGASIGKQCVIGANAVVTHDVPDYSVAAGSPARIIKRYCFETNNWRRTSSDGKFLD